MTLDLAAWDRLADALEYPGDAPSQIQERYVEAFDLDPAATLDVGWHLFGDRPDRGQFLSILREQLSSAGVSEGTNLPDHLPTVLRLIARQDDEHASALAALIAPAAARVLARLRAQHSPFVDPMEAVACALDDRGRHGGQP